MDPKKDYYGVLGVLPAAEEIVIRAAYKALAQRYHPDRYAGSKDEAHRRMAEINEAYKVLSNADTRREYDRARGTNTQSGDAYFAGGGGDAPPPFDPLEKDWQLALKYYPDLAELESKLSRISWRLAYSYRAYMLEEKLFDQRKKVADAIEQTFLETYFGTNPRLVAFARDLINLGYRAAAKALNDTVRVLGSRTDPDRIIQQIRNEFCVEMSIDLESFRALATKMRKWGYEESTILEQLLSRGLRQQEAEFLARTVCRGE